MSTSRSSQFALASALVLACASVSFAQDVVRKAEGGGISVAGWKGQVDAGEAARGQKIENSKLSGNRAVLYITTGPATVYWKPENVASGDYTVRANITEPKYMNLMSHPHPYGIFIGGNDMGTDNESLLYCAAYGNGSFIVRGFAPAPFKMNGGGETHAAVHKAEGQGKPVTQEIALSVKGDKVTCAINDVVVASYDKSAVVGSGKLKSTDGVYGIRFAHNTEGTVTGLTLTKP